MEGLPNDPIRRLATRWHWKRSLAYDFLVGQMSHLDRREINRVMTAYIGPEDASVDLVPAVSPRIASDIPVMTI
jgi:hypothetical protein